MHGAMDAGIFILDACDWYGAGHIELLIDVQRCNRNHGGSSPVRALKRQSLQEV